MKRTVSTISDMARDVSGTRRRVSNEGGCSVTDGFPRWAKGTVWIHLSEDPKYQYQLHKAVLERTSPWFLDEFKKTIDESSKLAVQAPKDGVKYLFILDHVGSSGEPSLVRKALHPKGRNVPSHESRRTGIAPRARESLQYPPPYSETIDLSSPRLEQSAAVKAENKQVSDQPLNESNLLPKQPRIEDENKAAKQLEHRLAAYNNLFRIFYNLTPEISHANIDIALDQCETLLKVAERYGSLYVVRPYLGNTFSQYRHALFVAIAKDPPRWLNVSIPLHSASIFSEAIIHLAGHWPCLPDWPWPTTLETIDRQVLQIVKGKARSLSERRSNIDRDILQNTIAQNGKTITLAASYETWVIVQLFRDWYLEQQSHYRKADKSSYGNLYRLLRKGGDAYLPAEKQVEMLNEVDECSFGAWEEVGEDLKLLKEFAQGAVEPLCKNGLMLDVEEAGVQYLTCVEVRTEDFPWMRFGGEEES